MSTGSYFSQYESPNIVIIPTMSCSPPSPKRRKLGNNTIVPTVDNAISEKEKLKTTQENKKNDSLNTEKHLDINQSSSAAKNPLKDGWASNYLQSIGLDKKSSIWNRKIPRKSTSQKCVIPIEPHKIMTYAYAPKTNVESKLVESQKKIVTHFNSLKDSNTKTEHLSKTEKHNIKGKSKDKQFKHESTKSASVITNSDEKRNKTTNVLSCNNKRTLKTTTKPFESHKRSIDTCASGEHRLQTKSEKVTNVKSQKGLNSPISTKHSSVSHRHKEKPNIKPIVIKQNHVQDNNKNKSKTNHNQIKPSENDTFSNYKGKHTKTKCPAENITTIKHVTKKHDIRDVSKLTVLKTSQHKSDLKSRGDCNTAEISKRTKTKETFTKNKSNPTPIKTTTIEKKTPITKSYRKIKLVINLICNNNSNPQKCNESSSNENHKHNTTCTVPNMDLDFLNDFDIDEIVESLNTCEKETNKYIQSDKDLDHCQSKGNIEIHGVTSDIYTNYDNTDALDLIKTLKGEEDDDLMRISFENAKDSLFSSNLDIDTRDSPILDNLSKSNNTNFTIPKDQPTKLVKIKEEGNFEILPKASSSTACDLKNLRIKKNMGNADKTCNIHKNVSKHEIVLSSSDGIQKGSLYRELNENKNNSNDLKNIMKSINVSHAVKADNSHKKERAIETPHTIIRNKGEESEHDVIQSLSEIVTKRSLSIELDENKKYSNDSKNVVRNITVGHADRSCNINKNERAPETRCSIITNKAEYSKHNFINFSSDNDKMKENKNNNIDLKEGEIKSKYVSHSNKACIDNKKSKEKQRTVIRNKAKESKHHVVQSSSVVVQSQSSSDSDAQELDEKQNNSNNLNNVILYNHVSHAEELCSINKIETSKEQQHTMRNKVEESNLDIIESSTDNYKKDCLSVEQNENTNNLKTKVKDESNINRVICETDSPSLKLNTDICKKIKACETIRESMNQEKLINNSLLPLVDQQIAEKLFNKEQNENRNSVNSNTNEGNVDKFINEKQCKNILKIDLENINPINEKEKKEFFTEVIYQQKLGKHSNDSQKYAEQEEKAINYDEKCIELNKAVKNRDDQMDNYVNNPINQQESTQRNSEYASPVKNNEEQNKIALNNNAIVKEVKNSDENVKKDKHENNKNVGNDSLVYKQKDVADNIQRGSSRNLWNSEENTRGNIKSKADLQDILKLEERLFAESGSNYSIVAILHTGRYSKIFKCQHPNGKNYALKMGTTNIKYYLGKEKKEMLNTLISDIPKSNLFIISLINAFNLGTNWCFLMEYYPKNLNEALREAGKPFTIERIQDFARQLVMAVMVLRNKNMVHLDIKPKHILINSSNNMLKLCGFDTLCYINKMKVLPNTGTVNYRAPELILGYESSFEIDVWSTGLVLYEMAVNRKLFPGIFNNDILYKQMCTLGCVPNDMIKKSRFGWVHFDGSKFMRKSGFKGQTINIVSKFEKNNRLCDSIYKAYFKNMDNNRNLPQQNCDIGKLSLFVKLLQKMLTIHPESRLPIEFVYANPFIYDAYAYQEW